MMNQKAKELGAVNTNFKNCHGLMRKVIILVLMILRYLERI